MCEVTHYQAWGNCNHQEEPKITPVKKGKTLFISVTMKERESSNVTQGGWCVLPLSLLRVLPLRLPPPALVVAAAAAAVAAVVKTLYFEIPRSAYVPRKSLYRPKNFTLEIFRWLAGHCRIPLSFFFSASSFSPFSLWLADFFFSLLPVYFCCLVSLSPNFTEMRSRPEGIKASIFSIKSWS